MPSSQASKEVKKEQARAISIREGAFSSAATAFGTTYIAPFALALKATATQIGLLNSLSSLAAPLAQLAGTHLLERSPRKSVVLSLIGIQALLWVPLALLAFLFHNLIGGTAMIYLLIITYTAIAALGGLLYPAWFSWIGDIINKQQRGNYFSKRNLVAGIVEIAATVISLIILRVYEPRGAVVLAYGLFFLAAAVARFNAYRIVQRQYDPPFKLPKKAYFSLWAFIRRYDNFGKFAVYQCFFHLALMIASPFFIVYMARELGFSPTMYITISLSGSVFHLLFLPIVGKISDKYGNRRLLIISNICFVLSPLAWIVIRNPIGILLVPQLIAGIANAAFGIGFTNFTYDSVSQRHRPLCIAYTSILIGIGTFLGSLLGGLLLDYTTSFASPFFFVFGLAAALRLIVALLFLPAIKEEKRVTPLPVHFHIGHPFKTMHAEAAWLSHLIVLLPRRKV